MSLLERLRDLVKEMEKDADDASIEPEIETPDELEEDIFEPADDFDLNYVQCTLEESAEPVRLSKEISDLKKSLAELTIDYELKKAQVIQRCQSNYEEIKSILEELRVEYGLPQSGHTINIPEIPGQLVTFTKD